MAVFKQAPRGGKISHRDAVKTKLPQKARSAAGKLAAKSAKKVTKGVRIKTLSVGPKAGKVISHAGTLRGGHLVTHFLNDEGAVNVERVVKHFGISKQQLAETMGVRPETVYRSSRASAPKTQTRATEMLEIVGRIVDWAGGEKQAMAWYRAEPIAAFGGRTAESLVKEGKATAVRDYLDQIATGGFV